MISDSVLSIAIGVIGILIGIILWLISWVKGRNQVELNLLYGNSPEIRKLSTQNRAIKVYYDDKEVESVTTAFVWLWNSGRKPLKPEDIPKNEELFISFQDEHSILNILDFKLLRCSKESSQINLTRTTDNKKLKLSFEYIDCNQGAAFQIQHDGTLNTNLRFDGEILGPKKELKIERREFSNLPLKRPTAFSKFIIALGCLSILLILLAIGYFSFVVFTYPVATKENDPFLSYVIDIGANLAFLNSAFINDSLNIGSIEIHKQDTVKYFVEIDSSYFDELALLGHRNYDMVKRRSDFSVTDLYSIPIGLLIIPVFLSVFLFHYYKKKRLNYPKSLVLF